MKRGMSENHGGERLRLCVLFFLHAHALGLWGVNLSNVLKAHGFEGIVPTAAVSLRCQRDIDDAILRALR